jgi:DNA-directed RNA polymerase subunit M/transcription elongation factor TFIIS
MAAIDNYFCKKCEALLEKNTNKKILRFNCPKCGDIEKASAEDTMIFEETRVKITSFTTLIKKAGGDRSIFKKRIDCKSCGGEFMKQIRLPNNLRLLNVCIDAKCGHYELV